MSFCCLKFKSFLLTRKISKVEIDLGVNERVEKSAPKPDTGARNVRKVDQPI